MCVGNRYLALPEFVLKPKRKGTEIFLVDYHNHHLTTNTSVPLPLEKKGFVFCDKMRLALRGF